MTASIGGAPALVEERPVDSVGEVLPELRFVRPMPGFPDQTRFALVRMGGAADGDSVGSVDTVDPDCAVFELRSLDNPDVRFLVGAPSAFFSDYSFDLDEVAVDELGLQSADDALVLVVLTVGADSASTTANLLAPVVVNARTRSAAQVILSGTDWPVRAAVV